MPKGDFRKLTERHPMSDETKESMRRLTVIAKVLMQSGRIRRYGRGDNRGFNFTKFSMDQFGLTHDQIQVCRARAVDQLEEIDRLDRQRIKSNKRPKRYDWEYLDKAA